MITKATSGLERLTTTERLTLCGILNVVFGNRVLVAGYYYNGPDADNYYGAVYEFTGGGVHTCESEIKLIAVSNRFFPDTGHAVEWALGVK